MPRKVLEYRCLLISPEDVAKEREALSEVVNNWNAHIGQELGARINLLRWETHAVPDMSGTAQSIINQQLLEDCDFAIAIFWSRLGTPTEEYDSGLIEEIYRLISQNTRVLIYFNESPIPQEMLKNDQFIRLQKVKEKFRQEGLLGTYNDIPNLKEQIQLHLTQVIGNLLSKDLQGISDLIKETSLTLPKPDVRVKIQTGFYGTGIGNPESVLIIKVENHSPQNVFMGNVFINLKDGNKLIQATDYVTGEMQGRRRLQPGESFSFNVSPQYLLEKVDIANLKSAAVQDDIERVYESTE